MINIKKCRKKIKLTQVDLAKAVGVSLNSIQNWEKGVTTPKSKNLKKLHKVLKIKED